MTGALMCEIMGDGTVPGDSSVGVALEVSVKVIKVSIEDSTTGVVFDLRRRFLGLRTGSEPEALEAASPSTAASVGEERVSATSRRWGEDVLKRSRGNIEARTVQVCRKKGDMGPRSAILDDVRFRERRFSR